MARILLITSGLTGILNASFEIVSRLESAGHQVIYASPKNVGERVNTQGIRYTQLAPLRHFKAPDLPQVTKPFRKLKRLKIRLERKNKMQQAALKQLGMEQFRKILKKENPGFVIIDIELHEYIMTTYTLKIPMVLLSQWYSLWKRPGLPPLLHDTIPGQGWKGSAIGLEWAWLKIKLQRQKVFLLKKLQQFGTNRRTVLLKYAKQIGFPLKYIRENYWPGPFTYSELPVISITSKELEFPHDIRPNLHYVGPMIYENRNEKVLSPEEEQKLQIAFTQKKFGKALIYCSVSTFLKGDPSFLKKLIQAVTGINKWILILGMGGLLKEKDLGDLPKNVFAFSWIPQLRVLSKADCSINHGGIHTINECIHFNVPMLVYSGKRSDQNGCAARIAYHKVGIKADKDLDDPNVIRKKIEQVLNDSKIKRNMAELHQNYTIKKAEKVFENTISKIIEKQIRFTSKEPKVNLI